MKRICTLILMLAIVASVKAVERPEGNRYRICGNIKDLKGWVYLELQEGRIDSTLAQGGKFTFEGSVDQLNFAKIYGEGRLFIPLVPDSREIIITGDMDKPKEIKLTGSPMTKKIMSVNDYLTGHLNKVFEAPVEGRDSVLKDFKKELSRVVAENADNLSGAIGVLENAYCLSAQEKMHNISLLSSKMQNNIHIQRLIKTAKAQLLVSEGKQYIDVQLTDTLGRSISLGEVVGKGKYVLLDFWASWCGPCIASLPNLKKVYDKYHPKGFEVFGVSLDSKRDSWSKAIVKHGIEWHHASALAGWDCPAAQSYGIEGVPSTFLIGPDGVILKKDIRIDELEQILQNNL